VLEPKEAYFHRISWTNWSNCLSLKVYFKKGYCSDVYKITVSIDPDNYWMESGVPKKHWLIFKQTSLSLTKNISMPTNKYNQLWLEIFSVVVHFISVLAPMIAVLGFVLRGLYVFIHQKDLDLDLWIQCYRTLFVLSYVKFFNVDFHGVLGSLVEIFGG
jgi:hypothetical protein